MREFFKTDNKQGAREWSWGARDPPPPPFCEYVAIIQVAKTRESEESTRNKSFPVLDSCLLHLQYRTSAVDHVKLNRVIYAT